MNSIKHSNDSKSASYDHASVLPTTGRFMGALSAGLVCVAVLAACGEQRQPTMQGSQATSSSALKPEVHGAGSPSAAEGDDDEDPSPEVFYAACEDLDVSASPPAFVEFDASGREDFDYDGEAFIDSALSYTVKVPVGERDEYRLELSECTKLGSDPRDCTTYPLDLIEDCASDHVRWGISPDNVVSGDSELTFQLTLYRGTEPVSTSRVENVVHWAAL